MNSHLLYPQIGKVIASTGSRQFPRMLHELIHAHLNIDALQIRQLHDEPTTCDATSSLLSETVFSSQERADEDFRDPSRQHLIRRKDNSRYAIHVLRADSAYGFSALERSRLEDISPLLLPMLEKHINALQPISPEQQAPQSLEQRFVERLAQLGLSLSQREREVCLGLLAGHTAPELSQRLALKANTVESYLRRAAIKLGISGRHSLMRWMYGEG
ncbi:MULTISPECIES: helix-turn-helix transcriptional regulator [Pseudomonas]|uniref:DNA-binding CsgD family transcriptional regulator n=1 Tax=Pseudomonas hunanensis TaxID=1247546 RepID=A0ACC6JXS4_9PSED|nr:MULTISPECIES: helix-turn-helix transcriptional regulator [Pseudomonas]MBP2262532.1 DNA-binding CsgD family transcriptional regulator [Pseudomonas sp. BP8]MDR6710992.1 DNA-binding CsgD family transcriptional regulator [Pseudomonas hunanensis]HDS1733726.1 helix-turn-helix transcriptional regulator [Pseudomonas putida]